MVEQTPRVILVRIPDWTIRSVQAAAETADPVIVAEKGKVIACCERAADDGVEIGLRVRAAQLRCPSGVVVQYDRRVEEQCFAPVLARIEAKVAPAVHVVRPGVAAVRASGPARFYGGEQAAADRMWQVMYAEGYPDATVGIADGLFAAEQAALRATPIRIVGRGGGGDFLAALEIGALNTAARGLGGPGGALVLALRQLGLRTLGQFAAVDHQKVVTRFGPDGGRGHLLAGGVDPTPLVPRREGADESVEATFPEPLELAEQVAARVEPMASRMLQHLGRSGRICDEVRILIRSTDGLSEKVWRHPWQFTSADLVSRVIWQLDELPQDPRRDVDGEVCGFPTGVEAVQLIPAARPAAEHAEGLFGARPAEHLMAILTRLQDRLGPRGVLAPSVTGGRLLKERRLLVPFGTLPDEVARSRVDQPWPGRLTGPAPGVVYEEPRAVRVETADGIPISPADEGEGTGAAPGWLTTPDGRRRRVIAWAGPWPIRQRWWGSRAVAVDRYQLVTEDQQAWVLAGADASWWAEARYD